MTLVDEERPQTKAAAEANLPPYFKPFLEPHDYKVLEGGRGGAKSRSIATWFAIEASQTRHRYLCTREFQTSMKDSVIKLIINAIYACGLEKLYKINRDSIYCPMTGSEFLFKGIKMDPQSIRSTEGIDRCWVEEAHVVSEESWQVLLPTLFREPGCQLWISFNPDTEADATWKHFIATPMPDTLHLHVTWRDNPWFTSGLNRQRLHMLKYDPEAYDWIWEGHCRKLSEAVIFRHRVSVDTFVPPAEARFFYGADWGFADDPSCLVRMFIHENVLFIDQEVFGWHVELNDLPELWEKNVEYDKQWPIACDNSRPETISYMRHHGWPACYGAEKWSGSVEDGIAFMKSFDRIVVHPRCPNIAQEFRLYSYKKDPKTNLILPVVVDKHNHGIDACRYGLVDLIRGGSGYFQISDKMLETLSRPRGRASGMSRGYR